MLLTSIGIWIATYSTGHLYIPNFQKQNIWTTTSSLNLFNGYGGSSFFLLLKNGRLHIVLVSVKTSEKNFSTKENDYGVLITL